MSIIGLDLEPAELVLQRRRDFRWMFQHLNAADEPTKFPPGRLFLELLTGGQHNAVQVVEVKRASSGTYKLGLFGGWSPPIDYYDVTNAPKNMGVDISDAIEAIPGVGVGNVDVRSVRLVPQWRFKLTLNEGVNEVQRITFVNKPDGNSTYKLVYGLGVTPALKVNSSAEQIQAALEKLPGLGSGNIQVTLDGSGGFYVEFVGSLANKNVMQIGAIARGFGFGLSGGPLKLGLICGVKVETITRGSAKLGEALVNMLNKTLNEFFDQFENLAGVDLDFEISDSKNIVFIATSKRTFVESDLFTFSVDVTANALKSFLNGISAFFGIFNTINVDFRWNHTFEVEFIGKLANKPIPAFDVDISSLGGLDKDQAVEVTVVKPGKERLTEWPFTIEGDTAYIKTEHVEVDKIKPRTQWQLVFMPEGEPAGGDPVALGTVVVQG